MPDVINQPIKFLGATVLSFNCQLGLGSSESTLNVDLIEDCEADPPDFFLPKDDSKIVGDAVYLNAGDFTFGGVLQSWTYTQSSSGRTFNVKITDPRQLLANTVIVTDSYLGQPIAGRNYFNAYAYWEGAILNNNCSVFGESKGGDRGMPYKKIVEALQTYAPTGGTIYSPTGHPYIVDFTTLPQNLPDYFRVSGPSITFLQMLEEICDVLGLDFFVNLYKINTSDVIQISYIDLKTQPGALTSIADYIDVYDGYATDLSYGQELRNEITKNVLFGEKQHYLTQVSGFNYFFGEDLIGNTYVPVVPYRYDECGFWISKMVTPLNLSLNTPLPSGGPYSIHELDIRAAMASFDLWQERVMSPSISGTLNQAVRATFPDCVADSRLVVDTGLGAGPAMEATQQAANSPPLADMNNNPTNARVKSNTNENFEDLDKIWNFVKNLGDTYYGKQFITPLSQLVCGYIDQDSPFAEKIFTDVPTNAGGWVEDGISVLSLSEPALGFFREDDGRIGCFAAFNVAGTGIINPDSSGLSSNTTNLPSSSSSYLPSSSSS